MEEETKTEGEQETTIEETEQSETSPNNDPLDSVEDVVALKIIAKQYGGKSSEIDSLDDREELLKATKKFRAIHQRKTRKDDTEVTPKDEPKGDFLTRKDLALINTKKAKVLAQDDEPDIYENWDEILPFVPKSASFDTEYDILEAMRDGYVVFRRRNPSAPEKENAGADLQTTRKPQGKSVQPKTVKKNVEDELPNFHASRPKKPEDWYK